MENIASSRLAIISIQKVDSRQKSEYLEFFGEEGPRGALQLPVLNDGLVKAAYPRGFYELRRVFFVAGLKPNLVFCIEKDPFERCFIGVLKTNKAVAAALNRCGGGENDDISLAKLRFH